MHVCTDYLQSTLCAVNILLLMFVIIITLLLSGDVELNPGPSPENPTDLKICHSNVRGLREKISAVKNELLYNYDIVCITESRLTANFSDESKLNFDRYYPVKDFRRDRTSDTGGGLLVFISEAITATRRKDLEHPDIETMFIEIRTKNNAFLLCVCYRPPDTPLQFWDDFQAQIDGCKQGSISKLLIVGDLNADPNSVNGPYLIQFALQNHMLLHIDEPTRITDHSATILDQFISNMTDNITNTEVLPPVSTSEVTSDHCTIALSLKFKISKHHCYDRHIWDYKHTYINTLITLLRQMLLTTPKTLGSVVPIPSNRWIPRGLYPESWTLS